MSTFSRQFQTTIPLINRIREKYDSTVVILITCESDYSSAKEALDLGASDYLVKPPAPFHEEDDYLTPLFLNETLFKIFKATRNISNLTYNRVLDEQLNRSNTDQLVGSSSSIALVKTQLESQRGKKTPILIYGEPGVGKLLVAKLISAQERPNHPPIFFDPQALPQEQLELELFGCVKSSIPGLGAEKIGLLEKAMDGDLIISSITQLPLQVQSKLILSMEKGLFVPLGGTKSKPLRFRLIATTHDNIHHMVRHNKFSRDLFNLLAVNTIKIDSLNERPSDVIELASFFLLRTGGIRYYFSESAIEQLKVMKFKGNGRELKCLIELALLNARNANRTEIISTDIHKFDATFFPLKRSDLSPNHFSSGKKWFQETYIKKALELCDNSKEELQNAIGISKTSIYSKVTIKDYQTKKQHDRKRS